MNINHHLWTRSALMLAIVLLLLFVPVSGWTATYWVDANRPNNSTNCAASQSRGSAWKTILAGLGCLSAGDTLLIGAGTYPEEIRDAFPAGTSWTNPVTIKAAPGEAVIWRPVGTEFIVYMQQPSQQYIIFDSLIFDGADRTVGGFVVTGGGPGNPGAHHIRLLNCEHRNGLTPITMSYTHHNEIIGGTIHDNGVIRPGIGGGVDHAIYFANEAPDMLVDGVHIYNQAGYGIHCYNPATVNDRNIFRNNVIHDNGLQTNSSGILYSCGRDGLVYNNITYSNGGAGIAIGHAAAAYNIGVYNNTVVGNLGGSGFYGLHINSVSGHIVRNNISWDNGGQRNYGDNSSGTTADHNLIGSDPQFVNKAGHDYSLQEGSPAIDTGVAISQVVNDHNGTPRPQGARYDIGAYEYRSSLTSMSPPPRNLRIAAP